MPESIGISSVSTVEAGDVSPLELVLAHPAFPSSRWRLQAFAPGECILREGEHTGALYLVRSGQVRVEGTVKLQSGRRFQAGVTTLRDGGVLGELALFDQQPHSASAYAESAALVAVIEGSALLDFLDQHRDLGYQVFHELLTQLAPRLRATSSRVYKFLAWGLNAHQLDR